MPPFLFMLYWFKSLFRKPADLVEPREPTKEDVAEALIAINKELQKRGELPPKDPKDYTLTLSSSRWSIERYCGRCKATISHSEYMSYICNSCGFFTPDLFKTRVFRQIWDGEKWVYQYQYDNNPENIEILDKPYRVDDQF